MQRILSLIPLLLLPFAPAHQATEGGRVIVLGFDGADARMAEKMMAEGSLPNLKALAEQGTFAPLTSTNPAESSAGWAAINTGLGPDGNGVPSFFGREFSASSGLPQVAPFHTETVTRSTKEMKLPGLLALLAGQGREVAAAGAGALSLLAFLILLAGIMRLRRKIALPLALLFGALGGYTAWYAAGYVPAEIPNVTKNLIQADGFWKVAGENGKRSIVLDAALAFDRPDAANTRVLAGLGLPDCRGDYGSWYLYTTNELAMGVWPNSEESGTGSGETFKVTWKADRIESKLPGPVLFWDKQLVQEKLDSVAAKLADPELGWQKSKELREVESELKEELKRFSKNEGRATAKLLVERIDEGRVRLTIGDESHELVPGEWSGWYHVTFEINPLISVHAVTRAHLLSLGETFELYVSTLDIDPEQPPFWQPISQPNSFAGELAQWTGEPYETVGWACMTNQIKDKKLPIEVFLEDIEFTMAWRERLTYAALARDDWELLFSVFSTPDRVQHMLYKYFDPQHPTHVAEDAARTITFFGESITLADVIPAIYRQIDRIVGKVMKEYLQPADTLLLCADHGFTSFRREMNVNNWLAEKGYLTIKEGLTTKDEDLQRSVDWSKTKAYSLGLGMVFVNLIGREAQGIVEASAAPALLEQIARDFLEVTDVPVEGAEPVRAGHDAEIMMGKLSGPHQDRCADLMLGLAENYRVSWGTAGGKVDLRTIKDEAGGPDRVGLDAIFKDNKNNWCGDHASVSPHVVTGIFFSSRPVVIPQGGVQVTHIAPTALDLLGVKPPPEYAQAPLTRR